MRQGRFGNGGSDRSPTDHHPTAADEPTQGRRRRSWVGTDLVGGGAGGDRVADEGGPRRGPTGSAVLDLRRLPAPRAVHRRLDQRVRIAGLLDVVGADLLRQQRARHQLHEPERVRGRPRSGALEVHHALRVTVRLGRPLRHDARGAGARRAPARRSAHRLDRPRAWPSRLTGRGVGADPTRHRRRAAAGDGPPTRQRAEHLRRAVRQAAHQWPLPRAARRAVPARGCDAQAAGVGSVRRHRQAVRCRRRGRRTDRHLRRGRGRGEAGLPAAQGSCPPLHARRRRGHHDRARSHDRATRPRVRRSVADRGDDRHRRSGAPVPTGVGRVVPRAVGAQARHADRAGDRLAPRADRRVGRPGRPARRPVRAARQEPVPGAAVPGELRGIDPADVHRRRARRRHVSAAPGHASGDAGVLRAAAGWPVRGDLLPARLRAAGRVEAAELAEDAGSVPLQPRQDVRAARRDGAVHEPLRVRRLDHTSFRGDDGVRRHRAARPPLPRTPGAVRVRPLRFRRRRDRQLRLQTSRPPARSKAPFPASRTST